VRLITSPKVYGVLRAVALAAGLLTAAALPTSADDFITNKDFDDLTPAEQTAARNAARGRKLPVLRICADPGNMPLSTDKLEGFQNKIAAILAEELGGTVSYFWRPYLERGLTRQTFDNRECDILLDIPSGYEHVLTTTPIYRTTYVFAYRSDKPRDIKSFDDPQLNNLRIGVFQHSGLREVLVRHGVKNNLDVHIISHDADLVPENQPWRQVQKVIDGQLDIAGVWGPFAGFLKTMRGAPLTIQPVNLMDDAVPLEFDLSIAMRRNDVVLKYMLDNALDARKDDIRKILEEFGVPLVQCSRCAVQGTLPSHGSYFERYMREAQKRFLEAPPEEAIHIDASKATPDQIVSSQKVDDWLKAGADVNVELGNAVLASDVERAKFLIGKGAAINGLGAEGLGPLHIAAKQRDSAMIGALLGLGADANGRDRDGWTPLLHAAYLNHVPSIELLAKAGADLNAKAPGGYTALALTIEEGKFFAAKALLKAGASANGPSGQDDLTPMMILASKKQASSRNTNINQSGGVLELAREVLAHGGDVNAVSKSGITALMVAASNDNAAMVGLLVQAGARADVKTPDGRTALAIAEANRNEASARALRLIAGQPAAKSQ
jgi:quinoprotein dehydrogenase-associated probable ABC transporter substrate-binding protein